MIGATKGKLLDTNKEFTLIIQEIGLNPASGNRIRNEVETITFSCELQPAFRLFDRLEIGGKTYLVQSTSIKHKQGSTGLYQSVVAVR